MIIGGAFQGKTCLCKGTVSGNCLEKWSGYRERMKLMTAEGVLDFQEFIRKELKAGNDLSNFAEELAVNNPDIILVSLEVGYGVVPMDAFDRKYREAVGRICTSLAAKSQKVIRVVCGIGMVIKNA